MGVAKYAAKDNFKELQSSMKSMYSDFDRLPGFNLARESAKNTRSLMQHLRNPSTINNPQAVTLSRRFQSIPLINNLTRTVNKTFDNIAKGKIWQDVEDEDIFGGGDFNEYSFSSEYDNFDFENFDQYILTNDEIDRNESVDTQKSKKKFESVGREKSSNSGMSSASLGVAKAQGQLSIATNKALANSMSLTMQTLHVERTTLLIKNHAEVASELKTLNSIQNKILETNHLQLKNQMTMIEAMKGIAEELREIKTDQKTIGGVSKTGEMRTEMSAYHQSFAEMIGSGQLTKGLMGGFQSSANKYSDKRGGGALSSIMQIAPFLPMLINTKTITQGAMKMGGKSLLGSKFDKLEEFMTNPAKAIGTALAGLAYSKNSVVSTLFSGFDESKRIYVNDINQRTISSKRPEDKATWTNANSEALNVVIPTLLGKILSANSGRPEEAYDYRTRTFKTLQQARREQVKKSPLDVDGIERLAKEQISFFKDGRIKASQLDNYRDVVFDPAKQKELEQTYVTVLLNAIKNGVDPKILMSNGSPKEVAKRLGIENSESVDIVMNMMRTLNKSGTQGSLAAVNRNIDMAKNYRQRVDSYNQELEYQNTYGAMASFGADMSAPPYITSDEYKQWWEYWRYKGRSDKQIMDMEKQFRKTGFGIISPTLTKTQFNEYKKIKIERQREEEGLKDNSSYASAYRGGGRRGTNRSSSGNDVSREEMTEIMDANIIDATLADKEFIATLVGSPTDKRNKLIREYINDQRDISHKVATKLSKVLMKVGRTKPLADNLKRYGGSDNIEDYNASDSDLAKYQERMDNRTELDTTSVSSAVSSVKDMAEEYYGTSKGKKTFNIGMGAAIGGIAGIMLKRSAGLRSPIMLPILAATIGSGFGLANKFSNITNVLMGEEGNDLMGNNKSKRENLISNLVTNILPASIIGSSIGKKVSGLTKKYVRYGAILGPILGAVTGVGSAFAISQMDLIRKALKGLGIGKLLGKTKIGGKIAGFMGIGEDDKTESTKDVVGENKGSLMDGGIENTSLKLKEGEEKEGKGLLAMGAIAFVGYKAIKKLMQVSFKQKLKNGQGIDAVGCALSAVAYSLANLLKDKTIRVTDFINIANNHIGVGGGVRTTFFKEVASRYSIPIDIYEGKRSYSDRKLKADLRKGAQVIVLADLIKGKPHYVVGVQGSNDGVKLFDPMAGESRGKENELSFRSFLALGSTYIVLQIPRAGFFNRPIYSAENNSEDEENYGMASHRGSRRDGIQEGMGPGGDLKTTTMGIKDRAKIAVGSISPFGKTKAIIQTLVHFLDPLLFNSDYIRDVLINQYGALKKLPRKREFTIGRQFGIMAKAQNFLRALNPMNALKDMWNGSFGLVFKGISNTFNGIKNTLNSVKDGIGSVVKSVAASFGWMWDKMGLGNITKGIKNLGVSTLRTVIAPGKFVFNQLFGKEGAIRGHLLPFLKDVGSSIGQGVMGFLSAPMDGLKKMGSMAKSGIKNIGKGVSWFGNKAAGLAGNLVGSVRDISGRIGHGIKGIFQGKGLSGFTEEKIMAVKVVSGHIDTVGSVGSVDSDVYRDAVKRSRNSLTQGTNGKFKSAMSHGIMDSAAFYRSNSTTRYEDQLQEQIKENELKNTTLLERIADGTGSGEDDNKKEKKGGLMDLLKSILMAMPFLIWEIGQQIGNPVEYAKNVATNLGHTVLKGGLKIFNKGVKMLTGAEGVDGIKYLGKKFVKGAGKEAVEDVSKVAIKSSIKEGGEKAIKTGVKNVVKEGTEQVVKEGASNPKVISKLIKTIIDVTTKFAAKAAGLPLIGKFFKKGLGKALAEAAPKIGKEIGENAAKQAVESGAKQAVKTGVRTTSSGLKDAGAATLGISYVVGLVIDVAFFAYDVQDGWRHAHDDFQVQPKEVTRAMQISSATAGGLISALSSAVTMIPGLSLIMTVVSIIIAMIPRALIAVIIYDIVRKHLDMDRERDYDNKDFEVTIIGEESHAEYEALKKKVKAGNATDEEKAKYEQYYDKLEDAKKKQVKEDEKKEKEEKIKENQKKADEINKNIKKNGYNYQNPYNPYMTTAPQNNPYNPYNIPSGRGTMDELFKSVGGAITGATNYFTSQVSGALAGRNLGNESMKSNGCAVAVAKMIFKFLRRNITTDTLIKIAKNHLDNSNATKITFFEELGGQIVNNREDLTKRLQKKGTAAALLRQGKGNNHYVAIFNDNGKILMGDPEKTEVESITLDGYEIKTMMSAAVFNIDDTSFDMSNFNLSGKGTSDEEANKTDNDKKPIKPMTERAKVRDSIGSKRDFSLGYKRTGVNPLELNTKRIGGVSMGGGNNTSIEKATEQPTAPVTTQGTVPTGNAVGSPTSQHGNIVKVLGGGKGWTDVQYADGTKMRRKGDRAWRNNNPGNMDIAGNGGGWQLSFGILGNDKGQGFKRTDEGRQPVFPNYEAGHKAMYELLFNRGYKDKKIQQAIAVYAPPSENATQKYIQMASQGISPQVISGPLGSYPETDRKRLMDNMKTVEGGKPGKEEPLAGGAASSKEVIFVSQKQLSNLPNFPIDVKIAGCAIAVAKMVNRFLGQGATDQRLYDAAKANVVNGLIDIKFFQVLNGGSMSTSSSPKQVDDLLNKGEGCIALLTRKNGIGHYVMIMNLNGKKYIGDPDGSKFWDYNINNQFVKDGRALYYWKKNEGSTKAQGGHKNDPKNKKNEVISGAVEGITNALTAAGNAIADVASGKTLSSSGKSGLNVDTISVQTLTDSSGNRISFGNTSSGSSGGAGPSGPSAWLDVARGFLNKATAADVQMFHKEGGNMNADYRTSWCASFTSYCLKKSGFAFPGSASSQYPVSTEGKKWFDQLQAPQVGALVVWRGPKAGHGHVAFVSEVGEGGKIRWIGGNQKASGADDGSINGKNVTEKSSLVDPATGHGVKGRSLVGFFWPKNGSGGSNTGTTTQKGNQQQPDTTIANDPKNDPKKNPKAVAGEGDNQLYPTNDSTGANKKQLLPDKFQLGKSTMNLLPGSDLFKQQKDAQMKRGLDQNTKTYKEPMWQKIGRGALDMFVGTRGFSKEGIQSYVQGKIQDQAKEWLAPFMEGMDEKNKAILERYSQGSTDIVNELQKITNNTSVANDMNNRLQVPQGGGVTNNLFSGNTNMGNEYSLLTETTQKWMSELALSNVKS